MFTGIVEEKGKVTSIHRKQESLTMNIAAETVTSDVRIGDSISVNGVCLTVTSFQETDFTVDIIPETFRTSSLSDVAPGTYVNLERAMRAQDRFGGHFVSGHVDAVGIITHKWKEANAVYITIEVSSEGIPYLSEKGSVAVDGTSLTVFAVHPSAFTISLIPETQRATILAEKQTGETVNLEYDVLAKYIDRLLAAKYQSSAEGTAGKVTAEKLQQFGFLD
ncbi:riboflavin synthase [Sediminibacillus dalangtanensis]|uniref:Riboflavin synthase n=1 Tax=Sediminibacillus dalangtanensis TaxID=2729421 RepID=A0ABX7VU07_9BACI|nr:riboflavin synthase [Sediminibacillus dalangtanensis]QTM98066.1 riboflavin synthase [Sediminibacillus dalangtanensis]